MADLEWLQPGPSSQRQSSGSAGTPGEGPDRRFDVLPALSDRPKHGASNAVDGSVTSGAQAAGANDPGPSGKSGYAIDLNFRHPLEDWLGRDLVRRLLGVVSRRRPGRPTLLEEILRTYGDLSAPLWQRIKYWPVHRLIDALRGSVPMEVFRRRVSEHSSTVRGLVATARSLAEFGLTVPQRFSAPLFAVWNFTNRCNLRCRHCYQDSRAQPGPDELTLQEKLRLVDELGELYVPMVALAGGEPTISPDLLPVLRRCRQYGMHISVATNGTTMTPRLAADLAEAGARYIEVSLDSVHPDKHDAFRGLPRMWQRTVRGMRYVVAQPGLRLGIAMCVHQGNFEEVEDMLRFAVDIGATCFAHFNFIPVGRGGRMAAGDLNPRQRESLLQTLNRWMQSGRIGVISTAPQLGRVCLVHATSEGRQACSHAGSGAGWKARVVAKYLGGCGAGRTYVCIQPNGDITPCVYMPQRVLGNVRTRRLADIFRANPFWALLCDRSKLTHHCGICRFRSYCGGCRARADSYFGSVNAGDPGCLFNEKHWESIVGPAHVAGNTSASEMKSPAVRTYDGCISTWAEPA